MHPKKLQLENLHANGLGTVSGSGLCASLSPRISLPGACAYATFTETCSEIIKGPLPKRPLSLSKKKVGARRKSPRKRKVSIHPRGFFLVDNILLNSYLQVVKFPSVQRDFGWLVRIRASDPHKETAGIIKLWVVTLDFVCCRCI